MTIEERANKTNKENQSRVEYWDYMSVVQLLVKFGQAERDDMRKEMEKERDEYYDTGERRGFHRAKIMAAKAVEDFRVGPTEDSREAVGQGLARKIRDLK